MIDPAAVRAALLRVRDRIAAAGGDPETVAVLAVTKGFGADAVTAALAAGLGAVGENYATELIDKFAALDGAGASWHFLGAVQRNKVARLAPLVAWWQAVSRVEEGAAIARRAPGATVLVQVDVAGIAGRGGCAPDRVGDLVGALGEEDLDVAGLMAVGPPGPPEEARAGFTLVSRLADGLSLPVRSMGMSGDFEIAVAAGATHVRVGTAIFGSRPRPAGALAAS